MASSNPSTDSLPGLTSSPSTWFNFFSTQIGSPTFHSTARNLIRVVLIIGVYCLIRPYILKHSARFQMRRLEAEKQRTRSEDEAEAEKIKVLEGKLSPSELRAYRRKMKEKEMKIPGVDSDDEGDEDEVVVADWGKRARVRQRKMVRKLMVQHEERLEEQQGKVDDKDIEEYLID